MLGNMDHSMLLDILRAIRAADAAALMQLVREIDSSSPDYYQVTAELLGLLQKMAVINMVPGSEGEEDMQELSALAPEFGADELQLYYQITLNGLRDLSMAPDPRSAFEMLLLRIVAFSPVGSSDAHRIVPESGNQTSAPAGEKQPDGEQQQWDEIIEALSIGGLEKELAMNCNLHEMDKDKIVLQIPRVCANLCSENAMNRLNKSLSAYFGRKRKLEILPTDAELETPTLIKKQHQEQMQQAAEQAIRDDKVVQALQDTFNADIDNSSVTPAEQ
jgi:DNA polymerase-3 subunit gamma/tau